MAPSTHKQLGVIFDCDGTLLDSMGFWHNLDQRLASRAGVALTKDDADYMTAATIAECSAYLHDKFGVGDSAQDVERMIDDEMMSYYENEAEPKLGALDLVRGLYEAGVPMGVASSTPPKLLHVGLERTGFAEYMKAIYSVDDFNSSKREPLVYNKVREVLGTKTEDTWGVEDALYAIRTLNAAGYKTLAIYDSEIAGSPSELESEADKFIMTFADLTAEDLFKLAD